MIIAVNDKRVGGMTVNGLEIELEISGPVIGLVVSRYKHAAEVEEQIRQAEASYREAIDKALNDNRRLGWVDIGVRAGGESSNLDSSRGHATNDGRGVAEDGNISVRNHQPYAAETLEVDHEDHQAPGGTNGERSTTPASNAEEQDREDLQQQNELKLDFESGSHCTSVASRSPTGRRAWNASGVAAALDCGQNNPKETDDETSQAPPTEDADGHETAVEQDDNSSGNAKLGCVCGTIHGLEIPVFWIQCESCQSWYNVSADCVGFTVQEAENLPSWTCWGCPSPESSYEEMDISGNQSPSQEKYADIPHLGRLEHAWNGSDAVVPTFELTAAEKNHPALASPVAADGSIQSKKPPTQPEDETYTAPVEKPPSGLEWDSTHGVWISTGNATNAKPPPKVVGKSVREDESTTEKRRPSSSVDQIAAGAGCVVPKKPPKQRRDGTFVAPRPDHTCRGMKWDSVRGVWTARIGDSLPQKRKAKAESPAPEESPPSEPSVRGSAQPILVGNFVRIRQHAWPGVNNEAGVAKVLKSYRDEDGGLLYDVKYVVGGRTAKRVKATFVCLNEWQE